jgi:hypothetical protein
MFDLAGVDQGLPRVVTSGHGLVGDGDAIVRFEGAGQVREGSGGAFFEGRGIKRHADEGVARDGDRLAFHPAFPL